MKIEKWYIEITDENKSILKEFYKTLPVKYDVKFKGYLSNIDVMNDGSFLIYNIEAPHCIEKGCEKITIEKFLEMYPEYNTNNNYEQIDLIL